MVWFSGLPRGSSGTLWGGPFFSGWFSDGCSRGNGSHHWHSAPREGPEPGCCPPSRARTRSGAIAYTPLSTRFDRPGGPARWPFRRMVTRDPADPPPPLPVPRVGQRTPPEGQRAPLRAHSHGPRVLRSSPPEDSSHMRAGTCKRKQSFAMRMILTTIAPPHPPPASAVPKRLTHHGGPRAPRDRARGWANSRSLRGKRSFGVRRWPR